LRSKQKQKINIKLTQITMKANQIYSQSANIYMNFTRQKLDKLCCFLHLILNKLFVCPWCKSKRTQFMHK